jgi:hypothetical protein
MRGFSRGKHDRVVQVPPTSVAAMYLRVISLPAFVLA